MTTEQTAVMTLGLNAFVIHSLSLPGALANNVPIRVRSAVACSIYAYGIDRSRRGIGDPFRDGSVTGNRVFADK